MPKKSLKTYNLPLPSSLRAMIKMTLIDSIAIEISTRADSTERMFDDIILSLGDYKWTLNYPCDEVTPVYNDGTFVKKFYSQFEPNTKHLFTVDAKGLKLSNIGKEFTLERRFNKQLEPHKNNNLHISDGTWWISNIKLYFNGVQVYSTEGGIGFKLDSKRMFFFQPIHVM